LNTGEWRGRQDVLSFVEAKQVRALKGVVTNPIGASMMTADAWRAKSKGQASADELERKIVLLSAYSSLAVLDVLNQITSEPGVQGRDFGKH
jgi:hypothetical protein